MSYTSGAKKRMARPAAAIASAALVGGSAVVVSAAQAPSADAQSCPAVEVIQIQGTGSSSQDKDPKQLKSMYPNYNFAERLVNKYPGQVRAWDVPYPSSINTMFHLISNSGIPGQAPSTEHTYGQSVQMGVDWSTKRMEQTARECPNTKFVITGYSQGASAAGNVATAVANDFVKGVTSDDIVAVMLVADPARSGNSQYDSWETTSTLYNEIPPGKMQRNLEIVAPEAVEGTVGWTGPRNLPMKGLYGKVLSLCDSNDIACTVEPGSILRDVADTANLTSNAFVNSDLGKKLSKGVNHFISNGGIDAVMAQDINRAGQIFGGAVQASGLGLLDAGAAFQALKETKNLAAILLGPNGFGSDVDGGFWKNIGPLIRGGLESGAYSLADTFNIPPIVVEGALKVFNRNAKELSTDGYWEELGGTIAKSGAFPAAHASYWTTNHINGRPSAEWAYSWAETAVGNAIAGKTFSYTPAGNVGSVIEPSLEAPEQIKGEEAPKVTGEKQNNETSAPAQPDAPSGGTSGASNKPAPGQGSNSGNATTNKTAPSTSAQKPSKGTGTGNKTEPSAPKDTAKAPAPATTKPSPVDTNADSGAPSATKKPLPLPGTNTAGEAGSSDSSAKAGGSNTGGVLIDGKGNVIGAKGRVTEDGKSVNIIDTSGKTVATGTVVINPASGEVTIVDESGKVIAKGGAVKDENGDIAVISGDGDVIAIRKKDEDEVVKAVSRRSDERDGDTATTAPDEAANDNFPADQSSERGERAILASTGSDLGGVVGLTSLVALISAAAVAGRRRTNQSDAASEATVSA